MPFQNLESYQPPVRLAFEALEQLSQTNLKQHLEPDTNCTRSSENLDQFKEVVMSALYKGIAEDRRLQAQQSDADIQKPVGLASYWSQSVH